MNATACSSSSAISQKLLEQNEDIIAAIVENLQLGRLDESLQHYMLLHGNLVALASELDNYPTEDGDAYADLDRFPDQIMRKDCLDDMLPYDERALPRPPLIPPCAECMQSKRSAKECRIDLKHVTASWQMNEMEQQEVLRNAQVILARQRQHIRQDRDKRAYKKWTDHEKYTLCLAISKYGILSTSKIAAVFPNRTDKQIRNFISKSLRDESAIPSLQDLIAHPPPGYVPPSQLAHLFRPPVPGGGDFMESERDQQNSSREATSLANNFGTMIGMAMGLSLVEFPEHKATETAPIKRPPQLTSSAPRFEALQPSFPSPLAPFTTAPVASSSSSSVASMSMESVGRMTYKELQERARKCTDKKEQAALLLMYYNQLKFGRKAPANAERNDPSPAVPPPVAPMLPAAHAPPAIMHHGIASSSSGMGARPELSMPPPPPGLRKPPPFARQGLMKLRQQIMQTQSQSQPMHPPPTHQPMQSVGSVEEAQQPQLQAFRAGNSMGQAALPIESSRSECPEVVEGSNQAAQEHRRGVVATTSGLKPAAGGAEGGDKAKKPRKKKDASESNKSSGAATGDAGDMEGKKKRGARKKKEVPIEDVTERDISEASSAIFSPTQDRQRRELPASFLQVVRGERNVDASYFGAEHDIERDGCLIEDLGTADGLSFF